MVRLSELYDVGHMFGFGEQMKGDSSSWVPSVTFGQIAVVERRVLEMAESSPGQCVFLLAFYPIQCTWEFA